jgi:hypothetical protein
MIRCPDYKKGKCVSELDFVDKNSGESCCPRHPDAIEREKFNNQIKEILK